MSNELTHHGIKDQKWGLRRFQNPDGSLTPAGRARYGVGEEQEGSKNSGSDSPTKSGGKSASGKSRRSTADMTDEELRVRINRLNLEEQYSNLVERQKTRETSYAKGLLVKVGKDFVEQSSRQAVSKLVSKIFDGKKEKSFDISKYKDMDVYKMDGDTIKKVSDWYLKATLIDKQRKELFPSVSQSPPGKKKEPSPPQKKKD